MILKLDTIDSPKFQLAIDLLKKGQGFEFNDVSFSLDKTKREICVGAYSSWSIKNVNQANALDDIQRGISTFEFIRDNNSKFAAIVEGLTVRHSLSYDYGNGTVELGYLKNGKVIIHN